MIKKCLVCNKEFRTFPSFIKTGDGKYCNQKCYHLSRIGKKRSFRSEEWRKNMSISRKGKHYSLVTEFKKECKFSEKTKQKMRENSWMKDKKGKKCPRWKGGKIKNQNGYILIFKPNHPFCYKTGYILEHRLVMEKHLGRYLKPKEIIHHKNGIKHDNRLSNLQIVCKKPHYGKVNCPFCNKEFLIR